MPGPARIISFPLDVYSVIRLLCHRIVVFLAFNRTPYYFPQWLYKFIVSSTLFNNFFFSFLSKTCQLFSNSQCLWSEAIRLLFTFLHHNHGLYHDFQCLNTISPQENTALLGGNDILRSTCPILRSPVITELRTLSFTAPQLLLVMS